MRLPIEPRSSFAAAAALAFLLACGPAPLERLEVSLPSDLETMEPPVQQQFRDAHGRLTELLADERSSAGALAEAYGRLGMIFHVYELRPGARLCYEEAGRLAPDELRWPFYRADLEIKGGDLDAAERAIGRARVLEPDHAAAATLHGAILAGLGRLDEAEALLAERTRVDPSYAAAWIQRARIALLRRDPRGALTHLHQAASVQPQSSELQYLLGQAHAAAGDREAAQRYLEALPERNLQFAPTSLDEPLLRDLRRLRAGSLDHLRAGARAVHRNQRLALVELDQALAADPGLLHARASRAWILLELGRLEEAQADLDRVLAEDPDHEHSLRFLATLEERRGDVAAAERLWRRALAVNPVSRDARFGLAGIDRRRGRLVEALAGYEETTSLDPGLAAAQFWRIVLLDALGRGAEASDLLDRVRGALPGDRPLALLAARKAAAAEESGARELASRLFAERPDLAAAETIAFVAALGGDFRLARRWQGDALAAVAAAGVEAPWAERRLTRYRAGARPERVWESDEDSLSLDLVVATSADPGAPS